MSGLATSDTWGILPILSSHPSFNNIPDRKVMTCKEDFSNVLYVNFFVQRVPTLHGFWDFSSSKICVSGLTQKSPTCAYVLAKNHGSGIRGSENRVLGGPPVVIN